MITSIASTATTASPEAAQQRRLVDAAQQFEGIFLQQMLKPMSSMGKEDKGVGSDDDDGGDAGALQSYGTEAMAKAISAAGGLGIAREVLAKLAPSEGVKHASSAENGETALKSGLGTPIQSGRRLP